MDVGEIMWTDVETTSLAFICSLLITIKVIIIICQAEDLSFSDVVK